MCGGCGAGGLHVFLEFMKKFCYICIAVSVCTGRYESLRRLIMSTISHIQQKIAHELHELNKLIERTLASPNELMNRVISTYLQTKGKQIRPILVILSGRLLGRTNASLMSAAASVELLHNASLIHDDVVDETKQRRGESTINGLWDNHIAVLVGDFFVSSSLQRALDTGDLRIINSVANLGKMLSIGELDQIYNARFHQLDEHAYFNIIDRKTASLFVSCVEMGGFAVGASSERIEPLSRFARLLGLCFQIKDDIFDYYGDAEVGKPTGNDLREGKITLPLLHVLTSGSDDECKKMAELSRKETLSADEIEMLINFAKERGGIDYAYQRMDLMRAEGVAILTSAYGEDNQAVRDLIDVFDYTIRRTY